MGELSPLEWIGIVGLSWVGLSLLIFAVWMGAFRQAWDEFWRILGRRW